MSLWMMFGRKANGKSISSISSKPSKLLSFPTFEAFESIEIIDSNLKQGLRAVPLPLPETSSVGDREPGGAAASGDTLSQVGAEQRQDRGDKRAMPEAEEPGPDEFAAHVEQVRAAWPDGPPMQCQDVPDWSAFCAGWWRDCFQCPYYDGNPNGSPCALWEAAFPGVVRWYPA